MRVHTVIVPLFILNFILTRDDEHLLLNVIYHSPIFLPYQICIVIKTLQMDSEDELQMRCQLKCPNLWYRSSGTITQRLIVEGIHKYDMQSNRSILIYCFAFKSA
ncbi:hypothetical protein T03_17933 [Trichinella britovi]|uniref:Uncharacterized protein n=1 Tax=Trichinella britovi TaxID=45882 RepID=A0A0V1CA17_TRIBR|nr:hypothetical protein T03_2077 [Trichinella britovi]KRY46164.1 hypothetical protein T03_4726 [Trichinella britovi]KRY46436.1 hypothetical protein T03_17933 [Trichinella britovi]